MQWRERKGKCELINYDYCQSFIWGGVGGGGGGGFARVAISTRTRYYAKLCTHARMVNTEQFTGHKYNFCSLFFFLLFALCLHS